MKVKKDVIALWAIIVLLFLFAIIELQTIPIIVYCGVLLVAVGLFASIGKANLLSTISLFFLMYLYFIALGPLGYYYKRGFSPEGLMQLILISLLLFVAGYFVAGLIKKRSIRDKKYLRINANKFKSAQEICQCLIIVSLFFKVVYIVRNRVYLFSGALGEGRITALSGNGLLLRLGSMWMVSFLVLYELRIKGEKIPWISYLGAGLSLILELFMGARTQLLTFALILLLMSSKKRYISLSKVVRFGLFAVLFLVIYKSFRDGLQSSFSIGNILFEAVLREPYTGCINLAYMLDAFPNKHPFFFGLAYLINIKMLLPGPDLDFTMTLKEIIGITFSGGGITPTVLGEFYINFGYVGCYIGMFLFGMMFKKLDIYNLKSESYFLPAFLIVNALLAIRGGISNQEITVLINVIIYIFICTFVNKFGKERNFSEKNSIASKKSHTL